MRVQVPPSAQMNNPRIIFIVGSTAIGKTKFAIQIAKEFNGEIVSADSRQVYRKLDIGTEKVKLDDTDGIKHHLIDVADYDEEYDVSIFENDAVKAIEKIEARGKLPIVVGGSPFYIQSVMYKNSFGKLSKNEKLREKLASYSNEELIKYIEKFDTEVLESIDIYNKRKLIRAIEILEAQGKIEKRDMQLRYNDGLILLLETNNQTIKDRIYKRLGNKMDALIKEVKDLYKDGLTYERMAELGMEYKIMSEFLQQKVTKEEAFDKIYSETIKFSKRQNTWNKKHFEKIETTKFVEQLIKHLDKDIELFVLKSITE